MEPEETISENAQLMIARGTLAHHVRPGVSFVETGTRHGDTVTMALELGAVRAFTVENQEPLFRAAQARFQKDPRVRLFLGDSPGILAGDILAKIDGPSVFWLDAHTTGKRSPILEELAAIAARPARDRTILIDDVRCYRRREWGVSLGEVVEAVLRTGDDLSIETTDGHAPNDILVVRPIP